MVALLIGGLLVSVMAIYSYAAYSEMRRSTYAVAQGRLETVSAEILRSIAASRRQLAGGARQAAADAALRGYLLAPTPRAKPAVETVLQTTLEPAAQVIGTQLLDAERRSILSVGRRGPEAGISEREQPLESASDVDSTNIGPMRVVNDSVVYSVAVPVITSGKTIGYVVQWRRFEMRGIDQLSRLLGARTAIYLRNRTDSLWSDFARVVRAPITTDTQTTHLQSYSRPGEGDVLAVARPIPGTPWTLVIEASREAAMAETTNFLKRMSVLGVVILLFALVGALWLSRRLTQPILTLTGAAERVAAGDYALELRLPARDDELGRLAEEFDVMVARVREVVGHYQRLFESVPVPLWIVDRETLRFLAVNDAAVKHYGYSREEFSAMTAVDIRPPEDVPRMRREVEEAEDQLALRGGWRHFKKDGTLIDVETRAHSIEFDGRSARIVVINDVTERLRAAAAVRQSQERYMRLIQEAPNGVNLATLDGRFLAVNPAFVEMLGFDSESELLARNARDGYANPDDRDALITRLQERGRIRRDEVQLRRKDGSLIVAQFSGRLVTDFETGEQYVEAMLEDVTEQRRIERQFHQAQKMDAVGQLAGGVAHDFNNLLTVIMSYSDILLLEMPAHGVHRQEMEAIRHAAESAATLTRQLLVFSRQQVVQPAVMRLNDLIAGTGKMLDRLIGEHIELATALDPQAGSVRVDAGQIEQVIVNLAINARDAMPDGGKLLIESKNVEFGEDCSDGTAVYPPGRYVTLVVSDTGIGMTAEIQARIFEPFFSTKPPGKGTGLGLATVYGIVKQSGGHISVYSEPGKGTSFKIYFPRIDGVPESVEASASTEPLPRGSETVLVVEDEAAVRDIVCRVLERQGYRVLPATDGATALDLLSRQADPVHLLVTDVVLPGVGGRILADQIVQLRPRCKVLFVSGYTDDAIVHHGVLFAGVQFLQKPFTPDVLAVKVRHVLDSVPADPVPLGRDA